MAFNPFTWFRKHQRVLFACLAVLTMLVFIGSFGQGDPFTKVLAFFGASRAKGDVVATLYGKEYRKGDLDQLAARRKAANDYIFRHAWVDAHPAQIKELTEGPLRFTTETPHLIKAAHIAQQFKQRVGPNMKQQLLTMETGLPTINPYVRQDLYERCRRDLRELEDTAQIDKVKEDPRQLEALSQLATMIAFQAWVLTQAPDDITMLLMTPTNAAAKLPREFYLGGTSSYEDLLDFAIWRQQADKLGIRLTDEDVMRQITHEFGGFAKLFKGTSWQREESVQKYVSGWRLEAQGLTSRDLLEALRDEFRVVLAQQTLVGSLMPRDLPTPVFTEQAQFKTWRDQRPAPRGGLGVRDFRAMFEGAPYPTAVMPEEFMRSLIEQRSTLRARLTPIAATHFLSEVKGQPSETELRRMFELYKDREPDPASPSPGFKEPRRILIEGVGINLDSDHYRNWGHNYQLGRYVATVSSAGNPWSILAAIGPDLSYPLHQFYMSQEPHWWGGTDPAFDARPGERPPQMRSVYLTDARTWLPSQSTPASSDIQTFLTFWGECAHAPQTGWLPSVVNVTLASRAHSLRVHRIASLVGLLSMTDPSLVISSLAFAEAAAPRVRLYNEPDTQVRLAMQSKDAMTTWHAQRVINEVRSKVNPSAKTAEIREALAELTKKHHLRTIEMTQEMTKVAMKSSLERGDHLGLGDLRQAWDRELQMASPRAQGPAISLRGFLALLFGEGPEGKEMARPYQPAGLGLYRAPALAADKKASDELLILPRSRQVFLFWRKVDKAAEPRESFAQARDEVLAAWRLEKARVLARDKAIDLARKIQHSQFDEKQLKAGEAEELLAKAGFRESFELANVAKLLPPEREIPGILTQYTPYQVPDPLLLKFPYPPTDLVDRLLAMVSVDRLLFAEMTGQPALAGVAGQTTVIADRPTNTFYVAVLQDLQMPNQQERTRVYASATTGDPLFGRFQAKKAEEYRESVLRQLRREAGGEASKISATGRFEIPETLRKAEAGRSDE